MKITIDTDVKTLSVDDGGGRRDMPLYSDEAFRLIGEQWVVVGWAQKYPYGFSWMGRPVIQLPEDMIRIQEVIHRVQPDVIVETGVAHGGSLVFYATLCKAMGRGRVIGVDVEIRPHNRKAIEAHPLFEFITLIEGSSTAPEIVAQVGKLIEPGARVLVLLDSNHTKAHVAAELEAYAEFVSPGSYIVATDGVMSAVADTPRGKTKWRWDNPTEAAAEFAARRPEFALEDPAPVFDERLTTAQFTHWPGAYLRKVA